MIAFSKNEIIYHFWQVVKGWFASTSCRLIFGIFQERRWIEAPSCFQSPDDDLLWTKTNYFSVLSKKSGTDLHFLTQRKNLFDLNVLHFNFPIRFPGKNKQLACYIFTIRSIIGSGSIQYPLFIVLQSCKLCSGCERIEDKWERVPDKTASIRNILSPLVKQISVEYWWPAIRLLHSSHKKRTFFCRATSRNFL